MRRHIILLFCLQSLIVLGADPVEDSFSPEHPVLSIAAAVSDPAGRSSSASASDPSGMLSPDSLADSDSEKPGNIIDIRHLQVVDIGELKIIISLRSKFMSLTREDRIFLILLISILLLFFIVLLLVSAAFLLRLKNNRARRRFTRLEKEWEPRIFGILNQENSDPNELYRRIRSGDRIFFIRFIVRILRNLKGEERQMMRDLSQPFVDLLQSRLRSGKQSDQVQVLHLIQEVGIWGFELGVQKLLLHRNRSLGILAMRVICQPDNVLMYPFLISHLHRFRNWDNKLLSSILAEGGADVAPVFRSIIGDSNSDPWLFILSADTLRRLGDYASSSVLRERMSLLKNREQITAALRLMEKVGGPEEVPLLLPLLESGDPVIRSNVIRTVGAVAPDSFIDILMEALSDRSIWVSTAAAVALAKGGLSEALQVQIDTGHPRALLLQQVIAEYAS